MSEVAKRRRFLLFLIKPSHYDNDGYVIQWMRSALPSNSLACLFGIARTPWRPRRSETTSTSRLSRSTRRTTASGPTASPARSGGGRSGLVGLVGVQSNQYPRALDIARPLRAAGVQVCIGGFHVSGCLAMLPERPESLKQSARSRHLAVRRRGRGPIRRGAAGRGDGSAEARSTTTSTTCRASRARPIRSCRAERVDRTIGMFSSFDAGRGCPFLCSFCTIINVQGASRAIAAPTTSSALVRSNHANGIRYFLHHRRQSGAQPQLGSDLRPADRSFATRGSIRASSSRSTRMCHKIPRFIEKATAAGCKRVFIGLENINPDNLIAARRRSRTTSPTIARCCRRGARSGASPIAAISSAFRTTRRNRSCATSRSSSANCRSTSCSSPC